MEKIQISRTRPSGPFRRFRFVILALFAAAVALLALPGAASAAADSAPNPGVRTLPVVRLGDGSLLISLPEDFKVGDCTQFAGSNLRMSPPNATGAVLATWTASAQTSHTNSHGDIWHQTVQFQTASGVVSMNVGNMDSVTMKSTLTRYGWRDTAVIQVNPFLFNISTTATWLAFC